MPVTNTSNTTNTLKYWYKYNQYSQYRLIGLRSSLGAHGDTNFPPHKTLIQD